MEICLYLQDKLRYDAGDSSYAFLPGWEPRLAEVGAVKALGEKKELTLTALVLGVLLAVVFGAANAYLGLRVGLTVSASVPAAVISMGVLRFVLRRDSILENNMVQTIGSAGESLAAGAIFTLPALYLWAEERPAEFAVPELLSVTLIALAGGTLGVLLMVPLRRPLIVTDKTLTYPEGLACADVLRAGEAGAKHAKNVFVGLGVAAAVKFVTGWLKCIPETFVWPVKVVRGAVGFDVSPALLGVGYIVGPKVSSFLFGGAMLGWMVLIPIIVATVPEAGAMWNDGNVKAVWSDAISAPQATLMKVIVEGIMDGGLPWNLIGIGAAIAAVLSLLRVPVMPVAIGMYLPVGLSVTMFAGGLLRWAVSRLHGEGASKVEDAGTLFSAGLVAGEGLCGIILALLALV